MIETFIKDTQIPGRKYTLDLFIYLFERLSKNYKQDAKYKFRTRLNLDLSYQKNFIRVKYKTRNHWSESMREKMFKSWKDLLTTVLSVNKRTDLEPEKYSWKENLNASNAGLVLEGIYSVYW